MDTDSMIEEEKKIDSEFDSLFETKSNSNLQLPPIQQTKKNKEAVVDAKSENSFQLPSLLSSFDETKDADLFSDILEEEEEEKGSKHLHFEDIAMELVHHAF